MLHNRIVIRHILFLPRHSEAKRFRGHRRIEHTKRGTTNEMSNRELFVSQLNVFSGFQRAFEEANYAVLGVPFDVTSTYRTGARFGPTAIRQASLNIETYSFRTGIDVEDLRLHDLGDLNVFTDTKKTLEMLELVIKDIVRAGKIPVTIGGEHTITLGTVRGWARELQEQPS